MKESKRRTYRKEGDGFLSRVYGDRTRINGFKLKEGSLRLDKRKKSFTVSVVRHWNCLSISQVVLHASLLETCKAKLDQALGNLM